MEVAEKKKLMVPKLRFRDFDDEWQKTTVGEATEFKNGKGHEQAIDDAGNFVVVNSKFVSTEGNVRKYTAEQICPLYEGDIAMVMSDIPRGKALAKCYYIEQNGLYSLNQRICGLSSDKNETRFLIHVINRNSYYLMFDSGVGQTNLRKDEVLDCPIRIPTLPEQKKIADFLSAVDARIKHLNRKKELLEQYKKGVMQRLFNYDAADDQEDYDSDAETKKSQSIKGHHNNHSSRQLRFKRPDGSNYPDWEEKRLGEVGLIQTGKTPSTANEDLWNGDIQFITPTDIEDGKKYQEITDRSVADDTKLKILPEGSIVYTCIASIGKIALTIKPAITNQQINAVLVKDDWSSELVYYQLLWMTPRIKSTQANTTLPIINKTEFSKLKLLLPVSKEEQQKIADFLSALDKKIEAVSTQIAKTQQFKKGLLQKMFV